MNIVTKTDSKIVHFIIRVWCLIFMYMPGSDLYRAYTEHVVYYKRRGLISLSEEPSLFWWSVGYDLLLASILIAVIIKNPFDYKAMFTKKT